MGKPFRRWQGPKIRTAQMPAARLVVVAKEDWRAVWDDFRNWLISAA